MDSLFEKTKIKSLVIHNRFIRSATWMSLADPDGECTENLYKSYETLASGGIGLIITGFAFVSREGQGPEGQLGIYADHLVDGLTTLVKRVHDKGGKIAVQIAHCGAMSRRQFNSGLDPLGPSEINVPGWDEAAKALNKKEILRVVDDFGAAASRAKNAGFDGIQLHFAHGYLGSQFLSPFYNRRQDEYGGSIENRLRFICEIYKAVCSAVGNDYPVMAKLNLEDFLEGGLSFDDGLKAAKKLGELGVDAIEVSGGTRDSQQLGPARRFKGLDEEAYFLKNASAVKNALPNTPVMMVGGLRSPLLMEKIHRETKIDYFSLSRPFIREPHLLKRWSANDLTPAACVSCSACFLSIKKGRGVFCVKADKKRRGAK